MWVLDNHTPYAAERSWTRDVRGVHLWVVAVRATYDVTAGGAVTLADEQPAPVLGPEYHGDPGASSLRYDSDLLRTKPCTDVVADACAHAPRGRKARRVAVSLRVGPVDKTLLVSGERVYRRRFLGGLTTSRPQPFEVRPIRYEWAYGGMDMTDDDPRRQRWDGRNPVGRGVCARRARLAGQPAHAIEYPSGAAAKRGPAGFGPIDAAWSPRRELAGSYDAAWERSRKPLLAADYDELHGSCAPADQRVARLLRGGERVELENLTPDGLLRFELPKVYLTFTTEFGRTREAHRAKLATVHLEPERARLTMVWQTALPVAARRTEHLDRTVIGAKPYLT